MLRIVACEDVKYVDMDLKVMTGNISGMSREGEIEVINRHTLRNHKDFSKYTLPELIDPLKPHFYIVKLGITGVYIIFLISAQKHRYSGYYSTASETFLFVSFRGDNLSR